MRKQTATMNILARLFRISALLGLAILSPLVLAQTETPDALAYHVLYMLKTHGGKTICLQRASTVFDVRRELLADQPELAAVDQTGNEKVARAMWSKYPCPFSPNRTELRTAVAADILGAWVYPESSQKLRYGPQVQAPRPGGLVMKCESVAFFEPNEMRVAQILGQVACPFVTAADVAPQRKNPLVATWELRQGGRLVVYRSDVPDHIEEWDTFIVKQDFAMQGTIFKTGDLLQYKRRERGNEFNATTQFRHLQSLK